MKKVTNSKMLCIVGGELPISEFILCGALFEIIFMGNNSQAATAASWFEFLDCKTTLGLS